MLGRRLPVEKAVSDARRVRVLANPERHDEPVRLTRLQDLIEDARPHQAAVVLTVRELLQVLEGPDAVEGDGGAVDSGVTGVGCTARSRRRPLRRSARTSKYWKQSM
jgi:hypothetical protein